MDRPAGVVDFIPDPTLYPFESKWFSGSVGPVHYIDEGSGRPLLLLHGNPDWSFLYRKIVEALRGEFRCVVPDYPGFGLSVHPDGYGYTAGRTRPGDRRTGRPPRPRRHDGDGPRLGWPDRHGHRFPAS